MKYLDENFCENSIEVKSYPGEPDLFYRPKTADKTMLSESDIGKDRGDYRTIDPKGKIIFDLGANIGGFAFRALKLGAKKVIAFEPDQYNFDMIRLNCGDDREDFVAIMAAVTANKIGEVTFYIPQSKQSACSGNLLPGTRKRAFKVNAVRFDDQLQLYKPNLIKMDIEGGEYDLLLGYTLPEFVRELIIEIHHPSKRSLPNRDNLWQSLVDQFGEPPEDRVQKIKFFNVHKITIAHFER
jgi:FkbM family methyltransferase